MTLASTWTLNCHALFDSRAGQQDLLDKSVLIQGSIWVPCLARVSGFCDQFQLVNHHQEKHAVKGCQVEVLMQTSIIVFNADRAIIWGRAQSWQGS